MNTVRHWFRTRWDALHWTMRVLLVVAWAIPLIVNVLTGDWLDALGLFAIGYIFVDWNFWDEFGSPILRELRAAERRGQKLVSIGYVNGDWELYTVKPNNESDET